MTNSNGSCESTWGAYYGVPSSIPSSHYCWERTTLCGVRQQAPSLLELQKAVVYISIVKELMCQHRSRRSSGEQRHNPRLQEI